MFNYTNLKNRKNKDAKNNNEYAFDEYIVKHKYDMQNVRQTISRLDT